MRQSFRPPGDAVPIAEQVDFGGNGARYQFSVSQNGVLAYSAGGGAGAYRLAWADRSGKATGTVASPSTYADFRLSPDEKRIVFDRSAAGNQDVWVMDLARGVTSRLTFDPAPDNAPLWSPDGLRILYGNNRSGGYDLYSKAATGAGKDSLRNSKWVRLLAYVTGSVNQELLLHKLANSGLPDSLEPTPADVLLRLLKQIAPHRI
jgi:dipeptidyl aminopeptidase/acylaminoacyl peptidase